MKNTILLTLLAICLLAFQEIKAQTTTVEQDSITISYVSKAENLIAELKAEIPSIKTDADYEKCNEKRLELRNLIKKDTTIKSQFLKTYQGLSRQVVQAKGKVSDTKTNALNQQMANDKKIIAESKERTAQNEKIIAESKEHIAANLKSIEEAKARLEKLNNTSKNLTEFIQYSKIFMPYAHDVMNRKAVLTDEWREKHHTIVVPLLDSENERTKQAAQGFQTIFLMLEKKSKTAEN